MSGSSRSKTASRSGGSGPTSLSRTSRAAIVRRLRADGARIARQFGLQYTAIEAEGTRVKRRYGSCHSDGRIKIRLTHVRTGEPLKYSSMIDTLCHELAHLKHFDHSPRFRAFYLRILTWARGAGIYRPAPRNGTPPGGLRRPQSGPRSPAPPRPRPQTEPGSQQLGLFTPRTERPPEVPRTKQGQSIFAQLIRWLDGQGPPPSAPDSGGG